MDLVELRSLALSLEPPMLKMNFEDTLTLSAATGDGSCGAEVAGRGHCGAAWVHGAVSGAKEEADHRCGAGCEPLHCVHGRAHLR